MWSICTDAPTPSPTSPISVVGISEFPLDRKAQAVDDAGNGVSLTSDVFNAIKPEEVQPSCAFLLAVTQTVRGL